MQGVPDGRRGRSDGSHDGVRAAYELTPDLAVQLGPHVPVAARVLVVRCVVVRDGVALEPRVFDLGLLAQLPCTVMTHVSIGNASDSNSQMISRTCVANLSVYIKFAWGKLGVLAWR